MAKALFATSTRHEDTLPPMSALQWTDVDGVLHGGWWVVGNVPQGNTTLVVVDTTDVMLDEMAADPNYLFIEDIPDDQTT